MTQVSARWVPELLQPDQKWLQHISKDKLWLLYSDLGNILQKFVTIDETWLHHFQLEIKQQAKQWKHAGCPALKKAKRVMSAGKVMALLFRDAEGVLLISYLAKYQTVTGAYYANLLWQVKKYIKRKCCGKVLFHQHNVPTHKSAVALTAVHDCGFELVDHPPYSPDLPPSDFSLIPKLKSEFSSWPPI